MEVTYDLLSGGLRPEAHPQRKNILKHTALLPLPTHLGKLASPIGEIQTAHCVLVQSTTITMSWEAPDLITRDHDCRLQHKPVPISDCIQLQSDMLWGSYHNILFRDFFISSTIPSAPPNTPLSTLICLTAGGSNGTRKLAQFDQDFIYISQGPYFLPPLTPPS